MSNLRRPASYRQLSASLHLDIRHFFGTYKHALAQGRELLFAAGNPSAIELACQKVNLGWQNEQALYVHRSLLAYLPPVLQAYVGCASLLYGDVNQADIIKVHRTSGKVTFLIYDDFSGKPLPELRQRIKVNLKTLWVQVFDHSGSGQLLFFKEKFLLPDDPVAQALAPLSEKLQKLGLSVRESFLAPRPDVKVLLGTLGLA